MKILSIKLHNYFKKILPPKYFMILLSLVFLFGCFFNFQKIIIFPYNYLGIIFVLLGIILNLRTDTLFKKNKTTVKPFEEPIKLIVSFPFNVSRHPMYLGMFLILLGSAIFCGELFSFVFPLIFAFLMERLFIPREEKNLQKVFGGDYVEYKNKTRRWI